jgi:tetratricopeptide (TPR) repeat protein
MLVVVAAGADAPRPVPPDRKAYEKAINTKDPREKIAALNAFVKQYPKSRRASDAWDAILNTLGEKMPDQSAEIRDTAKRYMASEPVGERAEVEQDIADTLADHKVLLKDAEQYAKKATTTTREKQFVKMVTEGRKKAGMKAVTAEELHRDYQKRQAGFAATLGRVYVLEGKTEQGRKLLEQALNDDPTISEASEALGLLDMQQGQNDKALSYLVRARLNGELKPDSQKALETLYRGSHSGSLDGFDDYLDAEYRKVSPDPPPPARYQPKAGQDRVVLAELFTGAACSPCAGADTAMDQVMERFPRSEVAVLMYHVHVPEPDPIANAGNVHRSADYDIPGTPTLEVDGERVMAGGSRRDFKNAYDPYDAAIEKALGAPAEAAIGLHASRDAGVIRVNATVDHVNRDPKNLRLYVALVEKKIRYSGENGIRFHPMAVRSLAGDDGGGFAIAPSEPTAIECSFDTAKLSSDLSKYLDDYEQYNDRFGPIKFIEKK